MANFAQKLEFELYHFPIILRTLPNSLFVQNKISESGKKQGKKFGTSQNDFLYLGVIIIT